MVEYFNKKMEGRIIKIVFLLYLVLYGLIEGISYAQTPVVVIPMAGDAAAPGLAGFAGGQQQLLLSKKDSVIRSVTMTFPSSGTAIVNASGGAFTSNTSDAYAVRCSINKNAPNNINFSDFFAIRMQHVVPNPPDGYGDFSQGIPIAGTRGFKVNKGTTRFDLVCDADPGTNVKIYNTQLTVMFFPAP